MADDEGPRVGRLAPDADGTATDDGDVDPGSEGVVGGGAAHATSDAAIVATAAAMRAIARDLEDVTLRGYPRRSSARRFRDRA
jgi:hypothetical protein